MCFPTIIHCNNSCIRLCRPFLAICPFIHIQTALTVFSWLIQTMTGFSDNVKWKSDCSAKLKQNTLKWCNISAKKKRKKCVLQISIWQTSLDGQIRSLQYFPFVSPLTGTFRRIVNEQFHPRFTISSHRYSDCFLDPLLQTFVLGRKGLIIFASSKLS